MGLPEAEGPAVLEPEESQDNHLHFPRIESVPGTQDCGFKIRNVLGHLECST